MTPSGASDEDPLSAAPIRQNVEITVVAEPATADIKNRFKEVVHMGFDVHYVGCPAHELQ